MNIKRFTDVKSRALILVLLILLTTVLLLSGCGSNTISFSLGTFKDFEENTILELGKSLTITQDKEKIENSKLIFNKNKDKGFDNINICFFGNNIENVTAKSKNKTILYNHYKTMSHRLECFSWYYYVDESKIDDYFNTEVDFLSKWDGGCIDEIKNVYFNGLNVLDMKMKGYSGSINTNLYAYDMLEYCNYTLSYLGEKTTVKKPIVYVEITVPTEKEVTEKEEDIIVQGDSLTANPRENTGDFIYRYEKLFYESQQAALKEKGTFDYSDLSGEIVDLSVKYTDGSTQCYELKISFDEVGNIVAELG